MIAGYEVVRGKDFVTMYACRDNGVRGMVASVHQDATLQEIAQEFIEVLASVNNVPVVIREVGR